jgi:ABC-2 type transport system ATP-binding protein
MKDLIQEYFKNIYQFLEFQQFELLDKKIIDLVLDTESLELYQKGIDFLELKSEKSDYLTLIKELEMFLSKKSIVNTQDLVILNQVEKKYSKSNFGMGPIDLQLKSGSIIGLVGENGNGKTTLLRVLAQELAITRGEINYNFEYNDLHDLRTQLIFIPQRTNVWHGRLYDNLYFVAASYQHKPAGAKLIVELLLHRFGLIKFKNYLWKDLSSGYKMRFELVRMMLRKPKLLLIDEPLANLDIIAQQTVLEDFKSIAKSPFRPLGIVLSSQQLYEVEKTSDKIVFLKNGKPENIFNTNEDQNNCLTLELESTLSLLELNHEINHFLEKEIVFNGGTYVVSLKDSIDIHVFMQHLVKNKIPIQYFRNISNSSRRFFDHS